MTHKVAWVNCSDLAAAMAIAIRVVERNPRVPVLANVLLKANDGDLLMVETTDLDMAIRIVVDGPVHDVDFAATLPARTLLDVLKTAKVPKLTPVCIDYANTDKSVVLGIDGLCVTMDGIDPADFPVMQMPDNVHAFTIPTGDLARLLKRTEFVVSAEETRYYLNGVYLHVTGGRDTARLRSVATDGHKMGQVDIALPEGAAGMPGVIIPHTTVGELIRLIKGKHAPETVGVRVHATRIEFTVGNVTLISKTVDGSFPDYRRVIPTENKKRLRLDRAGLMSAIELVTCMAPKRGCTVRLSIADSGVTLSTAEFGTGVVPINIAADYEHDPLDIVFNSQYLMAILGHLESERVKIMLAGPASPVLIRGVDDADKDVLYVLMPMP